MEERSFRYEVVDDPGDFPGLETEWDRLSEKLAGHITVFASYLWYQTWWQFYGADAKLHLFTMWQADNLLGIAPLMWKKSSLHGLPVRTAGFIQNNQSLHNDFLVIPQFRAIFLEKMLQSLFSLSQWWDVLYFRNLSTISDNYKSIAETLDREGRSWRQQPNATNSPYLVPTESWEDYYAKRSKRTRKNLKNIQNKINHAGKVSVKNFRTLEEFLACKEELFEVARQSWSEGVKDSLGSPANKDFYESLAQKAAAKGWLSIWVLYLDDRMIAVEFHLKAHGKEHAMRGHYLPEFAHLSPGTYLEAAILKHVFEEQERLQVYDFCGSFDSYKKKWTETSVPHCDLFAFQEKIYSQCAMIHEFKLVPGAKKVVQWSKGLFRQGRA